MNNRLAVKEKLLAFIDSIQSERDGLISDLKLDKAQAQKIEQLTQELEGVNPNFYPLVSRSFFASRGLATPILNR